MEDLIHFYVSVLGIPRELAILHTVKFERQEIPKKTILLKQGDTEDYLYFISEGIVRFFVNKPHPTEPPKEITFSFIAKNMFCSAYDSFITRRPCHYNIETLKDTTIYRIHYHDLQDLYESTEIGNYIGRISAEGLYVRKVQREMSLLMYSAEERYLDLLKTYPEYVLQIPLKYIASYLGITPQALSRIRKQIS
ncbi:Crp/Fnr family transcriptional regulator [Chryseobacterium sp. PBS4-4]|uniref:Crp/Fnr family transcriptional regulator n=1 Tax=Chryseobacterium edaphi TaxID=2976532 RepID=A0ABT2WD80_9FLAO|nr:Crp/Fnr family transcriptional regulator [Chryseobacterium edaphi]MCU7618575.1 Crp/Fnr family transcriptional regulator [Chryseobacterium edaphi]